MVHTGACVWVRVEALTQEPVIVVHSIQISPSTCVLLKVTVFQRRAGRVSHQHVIESHVPLLALPSDPFHNNLSHSTVRLNTRQHSTAHQQCHLQCQEVACVSDSECAIKGAMPPRLFSEIPHTPPTSMTPSLAPLSLWWWHVIMSCF